MGPRRFEMAAMLLLAVLGCDRSDEAPTPATTSAPPPAVETVEPVMRSLPGVHLIDEREAGEKRYAIGEETVVTLLLVALEGGIDVKKLPEGGFRVESAPAGSPLAQLGLASGDIVERINDVAIEDFDDLHEAHDMLRDEERIELQGRRGSHTLQHLYRLRSPGSDSKPTGIDSGTRAAIDNGIRKLNDTRFRIATDALQAIVENDAVLDKSARLVPHREGGRPSGIRVHAIREGTVLDLLGLENGDTLLTLGDHGLASPEKLREAYAVAETRSELVLTIERNGEELKLTHLIH